VRRALVILIGLARIAAADPGEQAFHAAEVRAAANDPGAIDALEAVGAARPVTRWTDDAWSEAAKAAERAGDLARAQRDLEQVLQISDDELLKRRARGDLARLAANAGQRGEFAEVAATHERLVAKIQAGGDPKPALRELGAVIDAHPTYPRAATAMLAIALGWERDGAFGTAHTWLVRARTAATPNEHERVFSDVARFAIRAGAFSEAESAIAALEDRGNAAELTEALGRARTRHALRGVLWVVLALVLAAAAATLRRDAGSWRAAGHRLLRPPLEVGFLLPIAIVLAVVAFTGNPLVARAVWAILAIGVAVAWLSGALLSTGRPLRRRRLAVHVVGAALAVVAASYLAIDRGRMIDLVVETWKHGPIPR
jgi:tetratricopeptide (TPR) repeat protein